ncbi:MAG TPA: tetratricopeptide repeat protein [Acidobacteriaceae bacterium]|jgi:tetratricopeptide (TPR) repeat protein|nr:tetratricopeptide repeat protein [Acidobacteriaceae bacterium]
MRRFLIAAALGLAASAVYLVAFPTATLYYEAIVVLHILGGAVFLLLGLPWISRLVRGRGLLEKTGWIVFLAGGAFGAVILFTGARRDRWSILYTHEIVSALACALLLAAWIGHRSGSRTAAAVPASQPFSLRSSLRIAACVALVALIGWGAWWIRTAPWQRAYVIRNPSIAPASMDQEGDGPNGPFFPSSAQTNTGKVVPEDYFMDSATCKQCHADIYKEWDSSAHHFSSFNNQWYRQAVVYMQQVDGVQSSKWCAGCHDAALFFPGNFNTPIAPRVHTPQANVGISCVVCHSVRRVKSTMGNGDFILEYPALQKLVASRNPYLRSVIDYLIEENPEPHRRTFLRRFMRDSQSAEYCSICHKVHLDVPVDNYRWIRGFDDYDNWQASGVSGLGARSFYYPPKPQNCIDCHMTEVRSQDAGNVDGMIHSHRFIAANTALPFVNGDKIQLDDTEKFLEDHKVRVDIFAISRETQPLAANNATPLSSQPQLETSFAVGEESANEVTTTSLGETNLAPITAPLERVQGQVVPGETARVDVVVRTLGVGHFFPGGTVDAFDCWLELKATDDNGRVLFWSGMVEGHGKGPVEPGAHFYRSLSIDAHGNPIDKRNAWATRATVYAHLIPPGAADTVHFRLQIPKDARGHIHLVAKLNYRKFAWINTHFAFAGISLPTGPHDVTKDYDDRKMEYTGDTNEVAGTIKAIPNLPIVVMATSEVDLDVLAKGSDPKPRVVLDQADWQRWNDYGIGLFLQGDLKAAEAAFARVTQIDPNNPDGWTNIGRVRVQEGNLAGAKVVLDRALAIAPQLARANYFYARMLRQTGDYEGSIAHLRVVLAQYPEDRVVHDDLGRVLFLQHKYAEARDEFLTTMSIDPEDLEANYNLMLCFTGLGDHKDSAAYEERYLRFKADEAAQTLTGPYREKHPDDNNERQPIHEHESVPLNIANANNQPARETTAPARLAAVAPPLSGVRGGGN